MLSLPDVTLVACYDFAHELHGMAINECLDLCKFGDVKIFVDGDITGDFSQFVNYEIPRRISTSHTLFIQWDSWIINPDAWTDEFLSYDYIGAPWWYEERNVGNSGFMLLSRRLMEFLADNRDAFPLGRPWDHVLCRDYQPRLHRFRWAPDSLAWKFSVERTGDGSPVKPFGFHGLFNFPRVLPPKALAARMALAAKEPHITGKPEWREVRWAS